VGDGFYQIRDEAPERAFIAAIARPTQRIDADVAELIATDAGMRVRRVAALSRLSMTTNVRTTGD
jgi:hypothetical protein